MLTTSNKNYFAVKKLRKNAENAGTAGFDREFDALVHISGKQNPHLMQLLTAFQHGEDFYLVFPLADCNLKDCFERESHVGDTQYFKWVLGQLVGLAKGILAIHEGTTTSELAVPGGPKIGYHHDLKPENILLSRWPREGEARFSEAERSFGRLQISDFGMGKFRDPATGSKSLNIKGTPTYAAPESQSEKQQSRPYDIWSFGCIILEILIWLIEGPQGRQDFLQSKCMTLDQSEMPTSSNTDQINPAVSSGNGSIPTESYWVIMGRDYIVNPAVLDHMQMLREQKVPRGYDVVVNDLLALVKDCLQVSKNSRPKAASVVTRIKRVEERTPK